MSKPVHWFICLNTGKSRAVLPFAGAEGVIAFLR
jgi:hypothetical protein